MAPTQAHSIPARIELGRILDVNTQNYTVAVSTLFSKKPQTGISFASPYQDVGSPGGIYVMPEVGSLCWVCFPSDGNRPFVLAWAAAQDEGDFRAGKRELNPGDTFLGTRDGNYLVLRRGGVVEMGGGSLCQRLFLPINNTVRDICENYALHTLGGDLEWTVARPEGTRDGKRPTLLKLKAREYASDKEPVAELLIGSHGEGDATILSLVIREGGQDGAQRKIELALDKEGSVVFVVRKDVAWRVDGTFYLTVGEEATAVVEGDMALVGKKDVSLESKQAMLLKAGKELRLDAPLVKAGKKVMVGNSPQPVALATPLLTWLASHVHGGPGTPPTAPPPAATILSKTLLASTS